MHEQRVVERRIARFQRDGNGARERRALRRRQRAGNSVHVAGKARDGKHTRRAIVAGAPRVAAWDVLHMWRWMMRR